MKRQPAPVHGSGQPVLGGRDVPGPVAYDGILDGETGIHMGDFSIQTFEESGRQNGIRYWYAHELMSSLGYQSWQSFQSVINKAMGACTRLEMDPTDCFVPEMVEVEGRQLKTFRLTRFACLLVTMSADSKKPEVAEAKVLLAGIADRLIERQMQSSDLGRLETRQDLKLAEKVMSGAAQDAGLESTQFGIFKNAGFLGMYNMSLKKLADHKGLPEGKQLYDFMGLEEMAGNLFRVTQTAARIKNKNVRGLNQLTNTAQEVGAEVRKMMVQNSGVAPERLALDEDVGEVRKQLRKVDREMKKLDGPKKPKPKKAK